MDVKTRCGAVVGESMQLCAKKMVFVLPVQYTLPEAMHLYAEDILQWGTLSTPARAGTTGSVPTGGNYSKNLESDVCV